MLIVHMCHQKKWMSKKTTSFFFPANVLRKLTSIVIVSVARFGVVSSNWTVTFCLFLHKNYNTTS